MTDLRRPAAEPDYQGKGGQAEVQTVGFGLQAILNEIAQLLTRFSKTGERGVVDLKSLPLSSGDQRSLHDALGTGEVEVTLNLGGDSYIRETSYHGVWWVQLNNDIGEVGAEYIEVAEVPEILPADRREMGLEAGRLIRNLRAGVLAGQERGVE